MAMQACAPHRKRAERVGWSVNVSISHLDPLTGDRRHVPGDCETWNIPHARHFGPSTSRVYFSEALDGVHIVAGDLR